MCKSEVSTAFGSFPSAMGIEDLVLVTRHRLFFSHYKVQIRSLAVLSGSGGNVLNKYFKESECSYMFVLQFKVDDSHVTGFSIYTLFFELYSY